MFLVCSIHSLSSNKLVLGVNVVHEVLHAVQLGVQRCTAGHVTVN